MKAVVGSFEWGKGGRRVKKGQVFQFFREGDPVPKKAKAPEPVKLLAREDCQPAPRKRRYVFRSSITGFFVSEAFAKRNPSTTVRQRI